jgi:superfamily I DNA and RNA helicase
MANSPKIIAVAGKGGVGKTSISATIVKILVEKFPDKKFLQLMQTRQLAFQPLSALMLKLLLMIFVRKLLKLLKTGKQKPLLNFWVTRDIKFLTQ